MFVFCQIPGAWRAENDQNDDPNDHGSFYNFMNSVATNYTILIVGSIIAGFGEAIIWTA